MICFGCEYEEPIVRENTDYYLSILVIYHSENSFVESKIIVSLLSWEKSTQNKKRLLYLLLRDLHIFFHRLRYESYPNYMILAILMHN